MKHILALLICVAGSQTFAAADPAADFIDQTMVKAKLILEEKDQTDRTLQMCALLREKIGSQTISDRWLQSYASIPRETAAVAQFTDMVPSIMMSKALPVLGSGGGNGKITVDPVSKDRGNGVFEVSLTVTANGKDYLGFAIVQQTASGFDLVDAEYMGFSAVDYQGREYQKFLKREFDKDPTNSLPVSALVEQITTADDYVACP